jgi:hypothetical protein
MAGWDQEMTAEERERLIERIATGITRRRLTTPAILFLEMHKPLSFLASQGVVVSSPFLAPFVGIENLQSAHHLLADRENVERLIRRVEEQAAEANKPPTTETAK